MARIKLLLQALTNIAWFVFSFYLYIRSKILMPSADTTFFTLMYLTLVIVQVAQLVWLLIKDTLQWMADKEWLSIAPSAPLWEDDTRPADAQNVASEE